MARDTIFICHATPDDNNFVRWLGARLTGHGYKVWADMFGLKGGMPFWNTIEDALREHACKVIYVASKASVDPKRQGVRNELSVADAVRKALGDPAFIIPVRLDDVAFSDFPILVHQLNAIDFSRGWGGQLIELLDTLEAANVFRSEGDQTAEFERWRQDAVKTAALVNNEPEPVLTSLSPISALPAEVLYLTHNADAAAISEALRVSSIPFSPFYQLLITFAGLDAINKALPTPMVAELRARTSLKEFLAGGVPGVTTPGRADASNIVTALLRQHVERHLMQRGLKALPALVQCVLFPDRARDQQQGPIHGGVGAADQQERRGPQRAAQSVLAPGDEGQRGPWTAVLRPLQALCGLLRGRPNCHCRPEADLAHSKALLQELVEPALAPASGGLRRVVGGWSDRVLDSAGWSSDLSPGWSPAPADSGAPYCR